MWYLRRACASLCLIAVLFCTGALSADVKTGLPPIIEATEPDAPMSLDAHLKTLEAEIAKVKAIKALAETPAPAPVPAESADKPIWEKILFSPTAIVVLVMCYFMGSNFLKKKYDVDMDKWNGLLIHAYNFAETSGLTRGIKGREKLAVAMEEFKRQHIETYGKRATEADIADFVNDIAKLAYDDDTSANLRQAQQTSAKDVPYRYDNGPQQMQGKTEVSAGIGETPSRGVAELVRKT